MLNDHKIHVCVLASFKIVWNLRNASRLSVFTTLIHINKISTMWTFFPTDKNRNQRWYIVSSILYISAITLYSNSSISAIYKTKGGHCGFEADTNITSNDQQPVCNDNSFHTIKGYLVLGYMYIIISTGSSAGVDFQAFPKERRKMYNFLPMNKHYINQQGELFNVYIPSTGLNHGITFSDIIIRPITKKLYTKKINIVNKLTS